MPIVTQAMVLLASSPGEYGRAPAGIIFCSMMKAARSLMSCAVSWGALPLTGIVPKPPTPVLPLVMVSIRYCGSSGSLVSPRFLIGASGGPIPPVRLAPWQVLQPEVL